MKKLLTTVVLALAAAGCFSSGPRYTIDMENEPVSIGKSVGAAKIQAAIVKAAAQREWIVVKNDLGHAELLQDARGKHEAVVSVTYGDDSFTVTYVSSKNLKYDPETRGIHGNYLTWVRNLKKAIRLAATQD